MLGLNNTDILTAITPLTSKIWMPGLTAITPLTSNFQRNFMNIPFSTEIYSRPLKKSEIKVPLTQKLIIFPKS